MASFTINKDQIPRLKVFNDYCKKMESISPIEEDQSYIIKNDKLYIYGKGAQAAQIDTILDISNVKLDKNESNGFGISSTNFINFLEKTQDDDISVAIKDQQITIKGLKTKPVFRQTLIWNKSEDEIKELETFISDTLKSNEFKRPITVTLGNQKNIISDLASMTKLLDVNQAVELNKDSIRFADNLNILRLSIAKNSISSDDNIILQRDITSLFKNIDSFILSDDKKWFYFDIQEYGIKMLFIPKASSWQYPTEDDMKEIIPDDPSITVKVETEKFYKALDEIDNVFDSESWRYKQIKFKTPNDFANEKILVFHYDNMKYEVITQVPIEILEQKDKKDNFEFVIPTVHFKFIKNILEEETTFDIVYSSKAISDPNGASIIVKNQKLKIVLAKMT
jgi:hypothetical protein